MYIIVNHGTPKLITPLNKTKINKNEAKDNKTKQNDFTDPLNRKIFKTLSYSNELGTAIGEIAPRLGAALWAPTFMYLGADIYDKYKNDKKGFNPSGKRALKEGVFQGMMSILVLPAVIFAGQLAVSPLSKLSRHKISTNAKDSVIRHTKDVISQSKGEMFDNYDKFKDTVIKTLTNKLEARENEKKTANIFKKIYNILTDKYPMINSDRNSLLAFAEENTKKVFEIKTAIQSGDKKSVPFKTLRKYNSVLPAMKEMYGHDYSGHALRSALKEYQNSLIFKNKLLKTLGGFISLALLAGPMYKFINNNVMKKYVNPEIDHLSNVSHEFVKTSQMKKVFNEMNTQNNVPNYFLDKNAPSLNRFWVEQLKNQP